MRDDEDPGAYAGEPPVGLGARRSRAAKVREDDVGLQLWASSAPSMTLAVSPMTRMPGMRLRRSASRGDMSECSSMISTVRSRLLFMDLEYGARQAPRKGQKSFREGGQSARL